MQVFSLYLTSDDLQLAYQCKSTTAQQAPPTRFLEGFFDSERCPSDGRQPLGPSLPPDGPVRVFFNHALLAPAAVGRLLAALAGAAVCPCETRCSIYTACCRHMPRRTWSRAAAHEAVRGRVYAPLELDEHLQHSQTKHFPPSPPDFNIGGLTHF